MTASDEGKIDSAVVAALLREHEDELRRFLTGVLRDSQLAGDAMQAALTKLVELGHTTEEETRKAWLFRVAFNEAMLLKRKEATGNRVLERVAWTQSNEAARPEERLIRSETVEGVREALQQLPAEQAQIVRMRIYEEKTFAAIAEELKIPLGTALGRMRSAMKKLRSKLDE